MTLAQIKKIRESLAECSMLLEVGEPDMIVELNTQLKRFFRDLYDAPYIYFTKYEEMNANIVYNINIIRATLEGMLAREENASRVYKILDLIDLGNKSTKKDDDTTAWRFLSTAFYGYNDKICFGDELKSAIISYQETREIPNGIFVERQIMYILKQLYEFAEYLCASKPNENTDKTVQKAGVPSSTIQIYNNNSQTQSTNIDINALIENTYQQIENTEFTGEQKEELNQRVKELEEIIKSKETKEKRWKKAKELLKWLAEQSVKVAAIIVPLLNKIV